MTVISTLGREIGPEDMWSKGNPRLQVAWDATSLYALSFCPQSYFLGIVEGWRGSTVDLEFGGFVAKGCEVFWKARLEGKSKARATLEAVKWTVEATGPAGEEGAWSPWGGKYVMEWHCLGKVPFKNEKGNRAKCPNAHVGYWRPEAGPGTCGTCGSDAENVLNWRPDDAKKNRYTVVRAVAWYCDEQGEESAVGGMKPMMLVDDDPAVELSFRVGLDRKTPSGEQYVLCGYLDRTASFGEEMFIVENKTTGRALGPRYWRGFSPNVQIDTYDWAGSKLFPDARVSGVMVEAVQVLVGGSRLGWTLCRRGESQRKEFEEDLLEDLIPRAEEYAEKGKWPKSRHNCWLCRFNKVCSVKPESRGQVLEADYKRVPWNPLEER